LSESGLEAVKTQRTLRATIDLVTKNSLAFVPSLLTLSCLGALLAIGCGNAGSGLADAARNISHRTSRLEGAGTAGAGDEAMEPAADMGLAGAAAAETTGTAERTGSAANDATPSAGPTPQDAPAMAVDAMHSDDSARCGDNKVEPDELCDVAIEAGHPGACPRTCEPLDSCHAAKLKVDSCWSKCVLGDEVPCG
jgi:hypothetical protein